MKRIIAMLKRLLRGSDSSFFAYCPHCGIDRHFAITSTRWFGSVPSISGHCEECGQEHSIYG